MSAHRLIRASAGSGKTWQLSGQFLAQLFAGTPPETILATTFTRKAAGEILGRVLERLAKAATDPLACRELAEAMQPASVTQASAAKLLQRLTRNLHRLRVSTLDSFFQQVARSLTLELGLSPGWKIVDEHTDAVLRQRAIDMVLSRQEIRQARRLMQMLARGSSQRSVRDLIDRTVNSYYQLYLLTKADAWNRIPKPVRLTRDQLQQAANDLAACDVAGKQLRNARAKDLEKAESGQWADFLKAGIAGRLAAGARKYGRQDIPEELIEPYERLIRHARSELLAEISERNQATWKLMDQFHNVYQKLRNDTGFTRFDDITRLLATADHAADGPRMHYRLDGSVRHLLLDEFQDTSIDQWSVLRRLVRQIVTGSGDGSILCVGDPKQAIYGWRGGVAEILDEVERNVPGISTDSLDESRRSAPAVIEVVNRVFRKLGEHANLDEYEDACRSWVVEFPDHTTHLENLPGFAEFRTSPQLPEETDEQQSAYLQWVAEQVRDLHQQCPAAEIGILLRKNATVARVVHELMKLGVPASEEGGTPPTDSPAVLAVMSLLQLASHPGDTVARFHVATSPLGRAVEFTDWEDDVAALTTAAAIRNRLLNDGYGLTLQSISERIEPACGVRDRVRLAQVVGEAWRFDETPSLNPAEFVRLLEDVRFSRRAVAPVRAMTIHQSKGLEFDIVVVSELTGDLFRPPSSAVGGADPAGPPEDVCTWIHRSLRDVLPRRIQEAFRQTVAHEVRGALCGLYVAMTRARHALHLLTDPRTDREKKTLAGLLAASLADTDALDADSRIWSAGDEFWYRHVPRFLAPGQPGSTPTSTRPPQIRLAPMTGGRHRGLTREAPSQHEQTRIAIPSRANGSGRDVLDGRTRGTLIHAWCELISWRDEQPLPAEDSLREVAAVTLSGHSGISFAALSGLMSEFRQWLDHPEIREAFSHHAARQAIAARLDIRDPEQLNLRLERERPFVFRRGNSIVQGTIDRLILVEQSGRYVAADVVDFKTDRLHGDREAWIALKKSDYAPQLDDYREAVHRCFRIPSETISCSLLLLEANSRTFV